MIQYETDRLLIRNYLEKDINDYFEYMSLESTALYEDFEPFSLEKCAKAVKDRLTNDFYWIVELKDKAKVIGDLSFSKSKYESYMIAYDFNELFHKNGYATEACEVLMRHIFTVLNGRRICADCDEGNTASWRLLERLGFRREGHCIEDVSFKNDIDGNPIYVNSYYYALLKKEWENKR